MNFYFKSTGFAIFAAVIFFCFSSFFLIILLNGYKCVNLFSSIMPLLNKNQLLFFSSVLNIWSMTSLIYFFYTKFKKDEEKQPRMLKTSLIFTLFSICFYILYFIVCDEYVCIESTCNYYNYLFYFHLTLLYILSPFLIFFVLKRDDLKRKFEVVEPILLIVWGFINLTGIVSYAYLSTLKAL